MLDRRQETKIVKAALEQAGISAQVLHGRGTGWGWLEIRLLNLDNLGEHIKDPVTSSHADCPRCQQKHKIEEQALQIAIVTTGRQGDYDGRITVE